MSRYVEMPVPNVAAGIDFSYQPNTADRFRLLSLYAELTTDATVANRQVALELETQSGDKFYKKTVVGVQTATQTVAYSWSSGSGPAFGGSAVEALTISDGVPDWWLYGGTKVLVSTANLDTGDQWAKMYITLRVGESFIIMQALDELEAQLSQ